MMASMGLEGCYIPGVVGSCSEVGFWLWLGMQWGEVEGIQLGVIRATPCSLRILNKVRRVKPVNVQGRLSEWDLALGTDHGQYPLPRC